MIDALTYMFAIVGIVVVIGAIAMFIYLAATDWK